MKLPRHPIALVTPRGGQSCPACKDAPRPRLLTAEKATFTDWKRHNIACAENGERVYAVNGRRVA